MKLFHTSAAILLLLLTGALSFAGDDPGPSAPQRMSRQTRMDLIRGFNAELVYIRSPFPMGKTGLTLQSSGQITPSGPELEQMISLWGPSVKPGDRAQITSIVIKDKSIRFEINGGPVKNTKWYQRISVGGAGGSTPVAPSDPQANPRGSYVDLVFPQFVPEIGPKELKELLHPVFDFDSKSALEAYLDTVPPKVKSAIQNHEVLVGMNREMVIYSKGRPTRKDREKEGETQWEEWIYGDPPQDVDFVRFVGDEVVRVETMKVGGEKIVRVEKEVTLQPPTEVANENHAPHPTVIPTLRRPGEETPNNAPTVTPAAGPAPLPPPPPPGADGGPGQQPGNPPHLQ